MTIQAGLSVALASLRSAVIAQLSDCGFRLGPETKLCRERHYIIAGSDFIDASVFIDDSEDVDGQAHNCIVVDVLPTGEGDINVRMLRSKKESIRKMQSGNSERVVLGLSFDTEDIPGWQMFGWP